MTDTSTLRNNKQNDHSKKAYSKKKSRDEKLRKFHSASFLRMHSCSDQKNYGTRANEMNPLCRIHRVRTPQPQASTTCTIAIISFINGLINGFVCLSPVSTLLRQLHTGSSRENNGDNLVQSECSTRQHRQSHHALNTAMVDQTDPLSTQKSSNHFYHVNAKQTGQ